MATIHVRLFAGLHQMIGKREVCIDVAEGGTVGDLNAALAREYPQVKGLLATTACAVDEEYVPRSHVLRDGDKVALIPPVSGGA